MRGIIIFILGLLFLLFLVQTKLEPISSDLIVVKDSVDVHVHISSIDSVLHIVKKFEGYSDTIYICPGGRKTIGYGFTYPLIWDKSTITMDEADSVLKDHLGWCIKMANKDGLCCERASAIASFIYNIGYGNYKKSRVRDAVLSGDTLDVLLDYCYASGIRLRGLEKRRMDELALYNSN